MSAVVYRFFNGDGALLYVGMTMAPRRRLSDHRRSQPWWDEVATITIEKHLDRGSARRAELLALRTECPRYNVSDVEPLDPEGRLRAVRAASRAMGAAATTMRDTRDELHAAILDALATGRPIGEVAAEAGYDREHVRRIRDGA